MTKAESIKAYEQRIKEAKQDMREDIKRIKEHYAELIKEHEDMIEKIRNMDID